MMWGRSKWVQPPRWLPQKGRFRGVGVHGSSAPLPEATSAPQGVSRPWSCKTQNLGHRSKEEKPRDTINQPSRCNTQEGLLSVAQPGDSDLLGGRAHRTANWVSFICSMVHMGYKVIGYMFAKQSYWYKLRGLLFKFKVILLVQPARAFVQI